jgi:ribonuclease-3
LLNRALTHSSSANESSDGQADNERLEFLGDAILGWIVGEWLFHSFPEFNEGHLSLLKNYLVSANHLLAAAHRIDLGKHLHLGRGEETAGGRSKQRLLVNAFEAILAAVYLDGGPGSARALIDRQILMAPDKLAELAGAGPPHDFRAELEKVTRNRNLPRPEYVLLGETGPGHARVFSMEVRIGKSISAIAEGRSKKAAAHNAAREVCQLLAETYST